jgi:hypothetical protein
VGDQNAVESRLRDWDEHTEFLLANGLLAVYRAASCFEICYPFTVVQGSNPSEIQFFQSRKAGNGCGQFGERVAAEIDLTKLLHHADGVWQVTQMVVSEVELAQMEEVRDGDRQRLQGIV